MIENTQKGSCLSTAAQKGWSDLSPPGCNAVCSENLYLLYPLTIRGILTEVKDFDFFVRTILKNSSYNKAERKGYYAIR